MTRWYLLGPGEKFEGRLSNETSQPNARIYAKVIFADAPIFPGTAKVLVYFSIDFRLFFSDFQQNVRHLPLPSRKITFGWTKSEFISSVADTGWNMGGWKLVGRYHTSCYVCNLYAVLPLVAYIFLCVSIFWKENSWKFSFGSLTFTAWCMYKRRQAGRLIILPCTQSQWLTPENPVWSWENCRLKSLRRSNNGPLLLSF